MRADFAPAPAAAPRRRRDPGAKLAEAVLALAGPATLVSHRETAWASITFAGSRHALTLRFAGEEAIAAAEEFLEALPEHQFDLPGKLVADAAIVEVAHDQLPSQVMVLTAELLVLDEG